MATPSRPPKEIAERVRGKLLEQETRRRIYERIQKVPGIHMRRLCRELATPMGTVEHHLYALEQGGVIVSHREGRRRSFYDASRVDRRDLDALHALRHRTQRQILVQLLATPHLSFGDLAGRVGMVESTASHHLQRLARAGLVRGLRVGRAKLYEVADAARLMGLIDAYRPTFRGMGPAGTAAPDVPRTPDRRNEGDADVTVFSGLLRRTRTLSFAAAPLRTVEASRHEDRPTL